jgi:glycosyltransferase involved in cell wall biosynthesis
LVVGGAAAEQYALSLGKSKQEIFIGPQSVSDLGGKNILTQRRHKDNHRFTFLYLGRIIPRKGLDILLMAFRQFEKERDDVFLLVGGDGRFKERCLVLCREMEIRNVEFKGSLDPNGIAQVYKKADVFVLPSYSYQGEYEAWGLVVNEAMSMGLPIITTTAVGAAYDLVYNGKNGLIVQENDVNQLYEAMRTILDQDLEKMGKCSRRIFEEKNDYVRMADAFTNAISHMHR